MLARNCISVGTVCRAFVRTAAVFSSLSETRSFRVSFWPKRFFRMALAMGSIIAVEAVLLSHMDRKEVFTIIPRMSLGMEGARARSETGAQEVLWSEFHTPEAYSPLVLQMAPIA